MDGNENDNLKSEVERLKSELVALRAKNDDLLSEVAVSDFLKEDVVEINRQRNGLEDEKKTLESLLMETREEATSTRTRYEHEFARLKAVLEQIEIENKELKAQVKNGGGGGVGAGMSEITESGAANLVDKETLSVITDATKNLARRVKSNFTGGTISFSKMQQQQEDKSDDSGDTSPSTEPPVMEEDLTGIQKAYDDAEVLKAIVVPLEEQIKALKDKLRDTDTLLREFEQRESESLFQSEILGRWLTGKSSFGEAMTDLEKRSQECQDTVETTSASNTSKTFTALLNARLGLVVKELNELKCQNNRNVVELERSLKKSADLRSQTAEANGRLLRCQQKHASELVAVAAVLTEEQKLSLSNSVSNNQTANDHHPQELKKSHSAVDVDAENQEIVILRSEWTAMAQQLDKMRALLGVGLDVDVVGSDQFKQLQSQLADLRVKSEKQSQREEKLKSELQIMEEQWNQRAEEHQSQTSELTKQVNQSKEMLTQLKGAYKGVFDDSRVRLQSLTIDRERIVSELKRLQQENDELLGKHDLKAQELQSQDINLPEKTEDMYTLLLTYREKLISAKLAAEHHEDKRRQQRAEFSNEIEILKEKILLMESCQSEMEALQKRLRDVENVAKKYEVDKTKLEKELETANIHRARAENKITEMKSRISNLQQELDNSVAVQTDFVRLSQSLQMELEKIRQSEKEVRWQHEDDILDCTSCHHSFSVTKRKHHCKHCGRIFCADCLTKVVNSGPNQRPNRVCEVCHTLLIANSAPYFSTVAPNLEN